MEEGEGIASAVSFSFDSDTDALLTKPSSSEPSVGTRIRLYSQL